MAKSVTRFYSSYFLFWRKNGLFVLIFTLNLYYTYKY